MSAQPDAEILPLRPADERAGLGAKAQYAPTRPRPREAEPAAEPERERRGFTLHMPSLPSARVFSGLLAGGSLIATASPAVLTVWASHRQAAGYYRHPLGRYPRLAYGAAHAFIEVPFLYLWAWSGHSPVLRVLVVATILAILRLGFGVSFIWSWL